MIRLSSIIIFCCVIGMPLTLYILGQRGEVMENRAPRVVAPVTWEGIENASWFASVNNYLIDHTPLREYAIRAHAWINWHLFPDENDVSVSRGREGWLFYNGGLDVKCEDKASIARRFYRLAEIAKEQRAKHGVDIRWIIAPNKEAVYPEYLTPLQMERATCAMANRNAMRDVLRDPALQPYILGLWDVLEQGKVEQQVYFRTDSHWNHVGVVMAMGSVFGWIWSYVDITADIKPGKETQWQGDLGKMLGLDTIRETETAWETSRPSVTGGRSNMAVCAEADNASRRSFRYHSKDMPIAKGKTVILRDSFFTLPMQLVAPFFSQVDISHLDHTPSANWPLIAACADTLVIESVERHMLGRSDIFIKTFSGRPAG